MLGEITSQNVCLEIAIFASSWIRTSSGIGSGIWKKEGKVVLGWRSPFLDLDQRWQYISRPSPGHQPHLGITVSTYDAVSWHSCLLRYMFTPMTLPDCLLHTLDVNLPCVQRSGIALNNLGDVIRGIATPYYVDVLRHQHRCIRAVSGIDRSLRCKPWRSNISLSPPPL